MRTISDNISIRGKQTRFTRRFLTLGLSLALLLGVGIIVALTALTQSASASPRLATEGQPGDAPLASHGSGAPDSLDCGPSWAVVTSPNPGTGYNYLQSVAVVSNNDAWAVGSDSSGSYSHSLAEHWNGSTWSVVPTVDVGTSSALYGVAAVSGNDVWAVGSSFVSSPYQTLLYSTLVEHWNGTAWSVVPSPNHNTDSTLLLSVTAVSNTDVWAVGYYFGTSANIPLIERWDGAHWTIVDHPNVGTGQNDFASISAASSDDVWIVGDYISGTIRPLTEHWTGSSWNVVPNDHVGTSTNALFGVSARSANDAWAVGHYYNGSTSQTLAEHWNGTAWTAVPTTNAGSSHNWLTSVSVADASDAWAAGWYDVGSVPKTLIERWNGSAWSTVTSPSPGMYGDEFQGVAAVYAGDVWAVGYSNDSANTSATLIERYNPCGPSPTPTNTPRPTNTPGGPTSTHTPISPTSTPMPLPTQCALQFEDVPNPSTFYTYVQCLACRGIINGYACGGTGEPCNPAHDPYFRPNRNVTRGQIAKIVDLSRSTHTPVSGQTFEDVPPGSTFYTYTEELYALGVMNGYPCGGLGEPCTPPTNRPYFRPNANATRGQLAKIDANAAGYIDPPVGQSFQDVPIASTFYTYTQRLTSRGVMSGYPCGSPEPCVPPANLPYFRPNADVTRGQTSKIVANTFYPNCQAP